MPTAGWSTTPPYTLASLLPTHNIKQLTSEQRHPSVSDGHQREHPGKTRAQPFTPWQQHGRVTTPAVPGLGPGHKHSIASDTAGTDSRSSTCPPPHESPETCALSGPLYPIVYSRLSAAPAQATDTSNLHINGRAQRNYDAILAVPGGHSSNKSLAFLSGVVLLEI